MHLDESAVSASSCGIPLRSKLKVLSLIVITALSAACAAKPAETTNPPVALRPLERMAGQEVVVLPVQYLSWTDSLGWGQQIRNRADFLATRSEEHTSELQSRRDLVCRLLLEKK